MKGISTRLMVDIIVLRKQISRDTDSLFRNPFLLMIRQRLSGFMSTPILQWVKNRPRMLWGHYWSSCLEIPPIHLKH